MRLSLLGLNFLLATCSAPAQSDALPAWSNGTKTPLVTSAEGFTLNGKPFRILSGELEYARIPRPYWRDRLRKTRALGLNTITVYVFWNLHEPRRGVYDFSGQNDVAEFLREAQQEGLSVILRPGPYVCAEWDLGGYPAWLLQDHDMILRSLQPQFMQAAAGWMKRLGRELAPLQASRGGPIIAVQVENEYGSFGHDHGYVEAMRKLVVESGFGESLLYTADGGDELVAGSLPHVLAAVDFGTGEAAHSLEQLDHFRPGTPRYAAEYWDGWFDHWGEKHQVTDAAKQAEEIGTMLDRGASFNLYMVHGGTSFGWMNGANNDHGNYQPDVSSYDYDAPLDESGRPRPKYFAVRDLIHKATGDTPPPVPDSPLLIALPTVKLEQSSSLWDRLPAAIASQAPLSMEDVGQSYGYILYRKQISGSGSMELAVEAVHSYARVYLDHQPVGVMDRRLGQKSLTLNVEGSHTLDILVENTGRINFTEAIRGERAGLIGSITLTGKPLTGWQTFPLPFSAAPGGTYTRKPCKGLCLYQATVIVEKPGDTYVNTQALSKGVLWVNGHLLGRFWNIGPSATLYLPGVWLHHGKNRITVFDLDGGPDRSVYGQLEPTYIVPASTK